MKSTLLKLLAVVAITIGLPMALHATAATTSQTIQRRDGASIAFPDATAAVKLLQGVLWSRNSSGYITNATDTAGELVVGIGSDEVDNSTGSAGDLDCVASRGIYLLDNSGTNALTDAHLKQPCYVEDNVTVASKTTNGIVAGIVEDVTSDGVWVNVAISPLSGIARRENVVVATSARTLTAAESGTVVSNAGASAAFAFTLPPATVGLSFTAVVEAAYELRLDPSGTETIALPSSGVQSAAGKYIGADAVGEKVVIICITAGTWDVISYSGTWTAES
jgi:hypothetical protein